MKHPTSVTKLQISTAFNSGTSITQLVNIFGYHRNSISKWIKDSELDPSFEKGRKIGSGRPSNFSGKTGKSLLRIISKPASKYGFETDFWTTNRISKVCRDRLKIRTSRMSIFRALTKFEQSYKKPEKRYYEACLEKQEDWVKNVLPRIKDILKNKNSILYFEDESSIQLAPVLGKTWGPIGKTSIQKITGRRGSVSAISALSRSGNLIFNIHASGKRFCSDDIIGFLTQMLAHHKNRHLIVIMDQAPCHKSKKVQDFVLEHKRLNVFYLPPRSPEYNPAEKIWSHLKHHELKSHQATTTDELKFLTKNKMKTMAKSKKKMQVIFNRCENSVLYL